MFNNQLSGTIPATIGVLTDLQSLYETSARYTHHHSPVYDMINGIYSLVTLCSMNLLIHTINSVLSLNQVSGTIPSEIGSLTNLLFLYVTTCWLQSTRCYFNTLLPVCTRTHCSCR